MSFLIVLFYLVVWSCGLVNLFILALLFLRDREGLYRTEFLLMLSFVLLLVLESLPFLVPLAAQGAEFDLLTGLIADLGQSLMIYALPAYVNLISKIEMRGKIDRVALVMAAVAMLAGVIGKVFMGDQHSSWITLSLNLVAIVYCLGLAVSSTIRIRMGLEDLHQENNETIRLAIRMGWVSLILLPLLICFDFFDLPLPFLGWRLPDGLHVNPLILLLWSVMLLALRSRSLLTKPNAMRLLPLQACPDFTDGYGISPREQEVVDLLIKGMSYEEMADRLCISLSTIKTHINRIYRKTGVNSKVELIHCLQNSQINRKVDISSS